MRKKEWLDNVKYEINQLKKYATKEELENIDFNELEPHNRRLCIYGQMTGNCESERAMNLMHKSVAKVISLQKAKNSKISLVENKTFSKVKKYIVDYNENLKEGNNREYKFFSTLEAYILMKNAKNKEIVKYLKGETNKLNL